MTQKVLLACITVLVLTGCVQRRYDWNNYDQELYNHYKNPAETEQFIAGLKQSVERSEASGKVPPGLYAEYGYILYETGNYPEAIKFFTKEQNRWPESRALMAKMIDNSRKKTAKAENRQSAEVAK